MSVLPGVPRSSSNTTRSTEYYYGSLYLNMAELRRMEEELANNPELLLQDVEALREWAKNQPHLPDIDDNVYLSIFLTRRYYDLEKAKQTLDNYLTFSTNVPEMTINRSIRRSGFHTFFDTHYIVPFDKRDSDGNVVILCYQVDTDPSKYDFPSFLKAGRSVLDAWLLENGSAKGQTVILDTRNFSLGCVMKVTISDLRNVVYFNKNCSPVSMKKIYMINASKLVYKMVTFFKPVLRANIFQRIKIFTPSEMDEFYSLVSKEWMPNEYGGNAGTLQELTNRTMEQVARHEELFDRLDRLKVEESKRPKKKPIKQLEID